MNQSENSLEKVLEAAPVRLRTGWLSWKDHILVVTDQRLILAVVTTALIKRVAAEAAQSAKEEGAGWWGAMKAQMRAQAQFSRRYLAMEPEAILAEQAANFAVPHGAVARIKYQPGGMRSDSNDMEQYEPGRLGIETSRDKIKLQLTGLERELLGALRPLFEKRLRG